MATSYTTNYKLDKYVATDKPNLRDQYNSAMDKIDAQMMINATAANNAQSTATAAKTAADTAQSTATAASKTHFWRFGATSESSETTDSAVNGGWNITTNIFNTVLAEHENYAEYFSANGGVATIVKAGFYRFRAQVHGASNKNAEPMRVGVGIGVNVNNNNYNAQAFSYAPNQVSTSATTELTHKCAVGDLIYFGCFADAKSDGTQWIRRDGGHSTFCEIEYLGE